jgi:hypothetical protein
VIVDDRRECQLCRGAKTYKWSIALGLFRNEPVSDAEKNNGGCNKVHPKRRWACELKQMRSHLVAAQDQQPDSPTETRRRNKERGFVQISVPHIATYHRSFRGMSPEGLIFKVVYRSVIVNAY